MPSSRNGSRIGWFRISARVAQLTQAIRPFPERSWLSIARSLGAPNWLSLAELSSVSITASPLALHRSQIFNDLWALTDDDRRANRGGGSIAWRSRVASFGGLPWQSESQFLRSSRRRNTYGSVHFSLQSLPVSRCDNGVEVVKSAILTNPRNTPALGVRPLKCVALARTLPTGRKIECRSNRHVECSDPKNS
jgi:hypothetical protein